MPAGSPASRCPASRRRVSIGMTPSKTRPVWLARMASSASWATLGRRSCRVGRMSTGSGRPRERSIMLAVRTMPARPCTASGSVWVGTISRSQAARALTISTPRVGGQSNSAWSKRGASASIARARTWPMPLRLALRFSRVASAGCAASSHRRPGSTSRSRVAGAGGGSSKSSNTPRGGGSCGTPSRCPSEACGSRSTSSTRCPRAASRLARASAEVVLPTPPFWLATVQARISAGLRGIRIAATSAAGPPVWLKPSNSPASVASTTITTRRFWSRPVGTALLSTGRVSP